MKHTIVVAFAVLVASAPAAAQTPFSKPESAVNYRRAAFYVMNNHMGRINTQLKSSMPNVQVIQSSAGVVEAMSKLPWDGFGHATEFVASKTRALPELFKNEAKVKELAEKMEEEATKLNNVAKTGDVKAVRTQLAATVSGVSMAFAPKVYQPLVSGDGSAERPLPLESRPLTVGRDRSNQPSYERIQAR
jgi:cytochrome c556